MHRDQPGAVVAGRRVLLAGITALALVVVGAHADARPAASADRLKVEASSADIHVANRYVATLRANVYDIGPAARAADIEERIGEMVDSGGKLVVTSEAIPEGAAILINGGIAFRILVADLDPDTTETPVHAASAAAQRLELALRELAEARDARTLLPAIGLTLLATIVLAMLLWGLARIRRAVVSRGQILVQRKTEQLAPSWVGQLFGRNGAQVFVTIPVRIAVWLLSLLFVYQYTGFVLRQFPYTRPWGETLRANLFAAVGGFASSVLHALPGLLFVVLIFMLARAIVRALRVFFAAVKSGRVHVHWVDEVTATPTERMVIVLVWLFALVAAYPYIPGSESEAFKGVGVFVGLMLSIGSSGIVNQAVSGLMLMYTRLLRPGEFVRIGDTEGTVTAVGFLTTRLETLRHEEVSIPNSVIASTTTRNYSRLAADDTLLVGTEVTIGYDTPWRMVHALLLESAARTQGVEQSPPPRVQQSGLMDSYVQYTLLVGVADPRQRLLVLSELHGRIQDAFNEHGVQIMTPNYEGDPESPKIVPRDDWFKVPAAAGPAASGLEDTPR